MTEWTSSDHARSLGLAGSTEQSWSPLLCNRGYGIPRSPGEEIAARLKKGWWLAVPAAGAVIGAWLLALVSGALFAILRWLTSSIPSDAIRITVLPYLVPGGNLQICAAVLLGLLGLALGTLLGSTLVCSMMRDQVGRLPWQYVPAVESPAREQASRRYISKGFVLERSGLSYEEPEAVSWGGKWAFSLFQWGSIWDVESGADLTAPGPYWEWLGPYKWHELEWTNYGRWDRHAHLLLAGTTCEDGRLTAFQYSRGSAGPTYGRVDFKIDVWNMRDGRLVGTLCSALKFTFRPGENVNGQIVMSAQGHRIISYERIVSYEHAGSVACAVRVWDIERGVGLKAPELPDRTYLAAVAISGNGKVGVAYVGDSTYVWDVESGAQLQVFTGRSTGEIAVDWDGQLAVMASGDDVLIYSLVDGREIATLGIGALYCEVSRDEQRVFFSKSGLSYAVVDILTGQVTRPAATSD